MKTLLEPVRPTAADADLACESSRQLASLASSKKAVQVRVLDDDLPTVTLPAPALRLLLDILTEMAQGNAITLIPIHAELTTQQAADLLGVSRPYLIKQLDEGKIPFRKLGTHRCIRYEDLLAYKQQEEAARLKVLEELTAQAQELGMGY